jgi:hypothetical protein
LTAALGRRHGFSAAGFQATSALHTDLLRHKRGTSRRLGTAATATAADANSGDGGDEVSDFNNDVARDKESADMRFALTHDSRAATEELVGTALVLAFLQVSQLLPVVQIQQHRSAAARQFGDLVTPSGWSFDATATAFLTLLSPGTLNTRERWWVKARLWRLLLAQHTDGYFEASDSVAFALEARTAAEVAVLTPSRMERLKDWLSSAHEVAGELLGGDFGDALSGGAAQEAAPAAAAPGSLAQQRSMAARHHHAAGGADDDAGSVSDDPLFCSAGALRGSVPRRLAALRAADPELLVERVWTTLCCIAFLETLNVCWLATDGDLYPAEERTVVDASREWLDRYAKEQPALAAALADGALADAAARTVVVWHRAWERRVEELRRSTPIRDHATLSQAHRTCTELVRAICTKHSTFSVFLSAPLDGLQRWQTWMILITLIIEQLLVNIWMYYARVRALRASLTLAWSAGIAT